MTIFLSSDNGAAADDMTIVTGHSSQRTDNQQ